MVVLTEGSTSGPEYVKRFAKQMLKNSIFIGTFHEKRFVEPLNAYRDVVAISTEETEFIENLIAVKKRIERDFDETYWMGITGPRGIGTPAGYNLWVELPIEIFGKYWFKVKTVDFLNNQISLRLSVIRPVKSENNSGSNDFSDSSTELNFNIIVPYIKFWAREKVLHIYNNVLTVENTKSLLIFISLFISTLVLSLINIAKYLMEYLLKLINELSKLIHTFTPIIINIINLCGKTIFALFHLIATLCKRNPPPQPIYNAYINYDPSNGIPSNFLFDKQFPRALPDIQSRPRATVRHIY